MLILMLYILSNYQLSVSNTFFATKARMRKQKIILSFIIHSLKSISKRNPKAEFCPSFIDVGNSSF